ncbi:hypothetical protein PVAP13_1KG460405 [Panicum virgatum]|uniref:Uncharacterized protein n=1 Tax=Panicum virgatum TaxID=38727 RepID=A0A8T0XZY7_PANVG|nr:hypothetical protein PVAP13_1KG460405 [Panicum virgatum]
MNCRTSATHGLHRTARNSAARFCNRTKTQRITARSPITVTSPPRRTRPRRPPRRREGIAVRRSPPATIPTQGRQVSAQNHQSTVLVAAFSCSAVRGFRRDVELPSVRPRAPHLASVPEPSCLATCRFLAGTAIPLPGGHGMSTSIPAQC